MQCYSLRKHGKIIRITRPLSGAPSGGMAKQGGAPKAEEMAKKGLEDRITQAPKRNFSSVPVAFGGYCTNS